MHNDNRIQELHRAVIRGDLKAVEKLQPTAHEINALNQISHLTSFWMAVETSNTKMAEVLLKFGASITVNMDRMVVVNLLVKANDDVKKYFLNLYDTEVNKINENELLKVEQVNLVICAFNLSKELGKETEKYQKIIKLAYSQLETQQKNLNLALMLQFHNVLINDFSSIEKFLEKIDLSELSTNELYLVSVLHLELARFYYENLNNTRNDFNKDKAEEFSKKLFSLNRYISVYAKNKFDLVVALLYHYFSLGSFNANKLVDVFNFDIKALYICEKIDNKDKSDGLKIWELSATKNLMYMFYKICEKLENDKNDKKNIEDDLKIMPTLAKLFFSAVKTRFKSYANEKTQRIVTQKMEIAALFFRMYLPLQNFNIINKLGNGEFIKSQLNDLAIDVLCFIENNVLSNSSLIKNLVFQGAGSVSEKDKSIEKLKINKNNCEIAVDIIGASDNPNCNALEKYFSDYLMNFISYCMNFSKKEYSEKIKEFISMYLEYFYLIKNKKQDGLGGYFKNNIFFDAKLTGRKECNIFFAVVNHMLVAAIACSYDRVIFANEFSNEEAMTFYNFSCSNIEKDCKFNEYVEFWIKPDIIINSLSSLQCFLSYYLQDFDCDGAPILHQALLLSSSSKELDPKLLSVHVVSKEYNSKMKDFMKLAFRQTCNVVNESSCIAVSVVYQRFLNNLDGKIEKFTFGKNTIKKIQQYYSFYLTQISFESYEKIAEHFAKLLHKNKDGISWFDRIIKHIYAVATIRSVDVEKMDDILNYLDDEFKKFCKHFDFEVKKEKNVKKKHNIYDYIKYVNILNFSYTELKVVGSDLCFVLQDQASLDALKIALKKHEIAFLQTKDIITIKNYEKIKTKKFKYVIDDIFLKLNPALFIASPVKKSENSKTEQVESFSSEKNVFDKSEEKSRESRLEKKYKSDFLFKSGYFTLFGSKIIKTNYNPWPKPSKKALDAWGKLQLDYSLSGEKEVKESEIDVSAIVQQTRKTNLQFLQFDDGDTKQENLPKTTNWSQAVPVSILGGLPGLIQDKDSNSESKKINKQIFDEIRHYLSSFIKNYESGVSVYFTKKQIKDMLYLACRIATLLTFVDYENQYTLFLDKNITKHLFNFKNILAHRLDLFLKKPQYLKYVAEIFKDFLAPYLDFIYQKSDSNSISLIDFENHPLYNNFVYVTTQGITELFLYKPNALIGKPYDLLKTCQFEFDLFIKHGNIMDIIYLGELLKSFSNERFQKCSQVFGSGINTACYSDHLKNIFTINPDIGLLQQLIDNEKHVDNFIETFTFKDFLILCVEIRNWFYHKKDFPVDKIIQILDKLPKDLLQENFDEKIAKLSGDVTIPQPSN